MNDLEQFRQRKDSLFAEPHGSPLTREQLKRFRGLEYYPENPDLTITASLAPHPDRGIVAMEATGGDSRPYRRAGIIRFSVAGQSVQLTLFGSDEDDHLFLPFRDGTSGEETYGSGRYLDVAQPENGRVVVDFNYAYNPYCAYNVAWSCPLSPRENWLTVPIRAGERDFPDHGEQ